MLRISVVHEEKGTKTFFLEGKICQSWTEELRAGIEEEIGQGKKVILDFSKVSFLDEEAASMLEHFKNQNVVMRNGSLFIRALLKLDERGKD